MRRRPRVVIDSNGTSWRWTPEHGLQVMVSAFMWDGTDGTGRIDDIAREVVGNLLLNPTEEVDE